LISIDNNNINILYSIFEPKLKELEAVVTSEVRE